jgi:myo-inositol-1-phosphate synthase
MLATKFRVNSPFVKYEEGSITSEYVYRNTEARMVNGEAIITPKETRYTFKTDTKVPRLGMMIVGFGGNNGSTVLAGVIANRE